MIRSEKGSILIIFLWILIVLGLFSASVAIRTRMATKLEGYEHKRFQRNFDYQAAVNLARFFIEQDQDPSVDFKDDLWYGVPEDFKKTDFGKRFEMKISDEESKLNINAASGELLRAFFKNLRTHGVPLKTDPADLAAGILAWRGGGASFGKSSLGFKHKRAPFESLEELYLVQHVRSEDVSLILPYLTVYGSDSSHTLRLNLNTVHPYILESLIESLEGGRFEKKALLEKIELFRNFKNVPGRTRQVFRQEDMDPNTLMTKLEVTPSAGMMLLTGALLRFTTVDSKAFGVGVRYKMPGAEDYRMEAVLGIRPEISAVKLDVLSWREGVVA